MSATAQIHTDGSAVLEVDGVTQKLAGYRVDVTRDRIRQLVQQRAAETGFPQILQAKEGEGYWEVLVYADGHTEQRTAPQAQSPVPEQPRTAPIAAANVQPANELQHLTRREVRSFVVPNQAPEEVPQQGVRKFLAQLGIKTKPSAAEVAEREDRLAVGQQWPGLRVVTVANGKGGSGKTPTLINLASMFGRIGGVGVLAADVNPFRGSLGWRTQQGPHQGTIRDLLTDIDHVLGGSAMAAEMAKYVHHQTADKFDVLRSQPRLLASAQRLTPDDLDGLIAVASKYYRMLFLDTGNDEADPLFARVISRTDQLVVATNTLMDRNEGGSLLLQELSDQNEKSAKLAREAVVVVSVSDKAATPARINQLVKDFTPLCREVVVVPHDPAMVDGWLKHDALAPQTQRAVLRAAAAVSRGF